MGSRYPLLPGGKIVSALGRDGFAVVSQRGSHIKMRKHDRTVIVPAHDEVARGTLRSILEQANLTLEQFLSLL